MDCVVTRLNLGKITMLLFLMLLAVSGVSTQTVRNTLSVSNGEQWGDWGYMDYCADGTYAVGYDMKIEDWQRNGDDTAMNGIKLVCQPPHGHTDDGPHGHTNSRLGSATSELGPWGRWVGEAHCDSRGGEQHFLTSFSLQVEPWRRNNDDTSVNYIKFKCRGLQGSLPSYEISRGSGFGRWGTYGEWSSECPAGQAICGIKTKIEPPQGDGDDTALNDVVFVCCC